MTHLNYNLILVYTYLASFGGIPLSPPMRKRERVSYRKVAK